ncbi:hypothetical protein JCM3774_004143 [Rhodotorula dairenensis]
MSRRDEALTAVDSLFTSVRNQVTAAINDARHSEQPTSSPSLAERLRLAVRPPTPERRHSASSSSPVRYWADAVRGRAHLIPDTLPTTTTTTTTATAAERPGVNRQPDEADSDQLPGYSRTPGSGLGTPVTAVDPSLPPRRPRRLESKSGKLVLDLEERGTADRLVVIQDPPDAATSIRGTLTLCLREPESITHVRIRLKGIVRTLVFKAHASGRHPVSDEVCFLEDSRPLWYRLDPQAGGPDASVVRPPPAGNLTPTEVYAASGKLQGTMQFPFAVTIPARLTHLPETGQPYEPRPIRPPPSFMLDGDTTSSSSSSTSPAAAALGGFEGSCRYYLKVTLGRAGLLKLNERWIIPIVFVPRQPVPVSPSPVRQHLALLAPPASAAPRLAMPDSKNDPQGWTDPGRYVTRTAMKKSRFKSSGATVAGWVRLEGKVPKPQKFIKAHGEVLEFEVQITCSDAASLARFTPATIAVSLLQRVIVTAQGISNTYDNIVLRANRVTAIGGPGGYTVRGVDGVVAHEIVYSGTIKLVPGLTTSFRAPNLQVAYLLCITLYQPTAPKSNGVVVTPSVHLSSLAIPVEIVSTPPRPALRPQQEQQQPELAGNSLLPPAFDDASGAVGVAARPLAPPQQAQSWAFSSEPQAAPPPPPMYPAPSGPPPPPRPQQMSSRTTAGASDASSSFSRRPVVGEGSIAASTTTTTATTTTTTTPAIDAAEEARLEEMYGLPPSYFDVVETR